jgi:hypothetical protein
MSTDLIYPDAYLAKFCTADREERAFADVDREGTFNTEWRNRLTVLRCYVIACLENQAAPDDLFTAKLKSYRAEYDAELVRARAAQPDASASGALIFSIPLERA